MKKLIPFLFIIIYSCNANQNKTKEASTPTNDSITNLQTLDGVAINLVEGYQVTDTVNDYILFPLQVKDAKGKEESFSSYSKESGEGALYWNVIFYNYKTNESALLEPTKKILIGGYNVYDNYYSNYGRKATAVGHIETTKYSSYIFYTVYTDDYNGDKKLSTEDPAYFFVSNNDGSNFRQVSPNNISVIQKTFPKNNSFLLLEGLKDANNDKKFNAADEKVFYKIDMSDSVLKVQEVFNSAFKLDLKKLFDKNWKK